MAAKRTEHPVALALRGGNPSAEILWPTNPAVPMGPFHRWRMHDALACLERDLSAPPFPLPSKDASGNSISYYVRSYSQYPGSPPSTPIVHGGAANPTAVTLGGTTQLNLLPSTGSGTASGTGTQGAQGFGKNAIRL